MSYTPKNIQPKAEAVKEESAPVVESEVVEEIEKKEEE